MREIVPGSGYAKIFISTPTLDSFSFVLYSKFSYTIIMINANVPIYECIYSPLITSYFVFWIL